MNQEMAERRRKVLLVITKSNFGGAQRYVYDLARNLDKNSFECTVAAGPAQGSDAPGLLMDKLKDAGIRTILVPELSRDVSFADIPAFFSLYALFKRERPDVVHLNSSKVGGLGALAARLARIPRIVFTSHGLAYDEPRPIYAKALIFISTWLTFLLSHVVICVSRNTSRRAARLPLCKSRVRLVYSGIEPPTFLSEADARAELLRRTGPVPPNIPWIGTVAELVPNKGLGYALRACEELKRSGRSFVFFIIGGGDQERMLSDAIANRGLAQEVRLLGYIPGAASLMKAFDIFTLTSRKEGLPYVLLEAAHAGVAVAATDIPGIDDVIENGVSGALSNPDDAQQFADTLIELLDDNALRTRFASALQKSVAEDFSTDRMVRSTTALYLPARAN